VTVQPNTFNFRRIKQTWFSATAFPTKLKYKIFSLNLPNYYLKNKMMNNWKTKIKNKLTAMSKKILTLTLNKIK